MNIKYRLNKKNKIKIKIKKKKKNFLKIKKV